MWLILSFIVALFTSFQDALNKKSSQKCDIYVATFSWWAFSLPFIYPLGLFQSFPAVDTSFWMMTGVTAVVLVFAVLLYIKGLESSDLSVSVPMMAFTPLFLLFTSPLILKEVASAQGVLGVCLVVGGSYVLFIDNRFKHVFTPFQLLFKEKGALYILAVAFVYSITGNIDKIGTLRTSPIWWAIIINTSMTLGLLAVMLIRSKSPWAQIRANYKHFILVGFCNAFAFICQMKAITLTLVPYVIAVKRSSIFFSALLGAIYFKERNLKAKLVGVGMMLAGIICLALF